MTEPNYKTFYDAVIDHLMVIGIYNKSHEHNPRQALRDIINWELDLDRDLDSWDNTDPLQDELPF